MNANISCQGRSSSSRLVSSGARPKQFARFRHGTEHEKLHYDLAVCLDLAKKLKDSAQQVNEAFSQIRNQLCSTDYTQKVEVLLEALHTSMLTMMTGEFLGFEIASSHEGNMDRWIQHLRDQLEVVVSAYLNRTAAKQGNDDEWQGELQRVIEDVSSKLLEVLIEESKTLC